MVQVSLPIDGILLLAFALLAVAVLVAGLSGRMQVPAALLFLSLGMVAGDDVLALARFDDPVLVQNIGVVALILILFEGGLTTKPSDLRQAALPGFLLSNVGVLLTALVTAAAIVVLLDLPWHTAFLLGAVVSSTDAAAVFDLLRRTPLPRRLGAILEVESGANDPFAIVLTLGLLEAWRASPSPLDWFWFGAVQLFGGIAGGVVVGAAGAWVLRRVELRTSTLYPVFALAIAGLAYALTARLGGSGFFAVYLAGLFVGALAPRHRRVIRGFHTSLANTADIALFLVLGLLVFPSRLPAVAAAALAVAAVLAIVARPLAVAACLTPFRVRWRDQAVVSWAGLRGAVPIVLSTFPFTAGHPHGDMMFDVVFFVVVVSVLVQGLTVTPLVRRLGLATPRPAWHSIAEGIPLDSIDTDLVELHVTGDLHVAGKRLRDIPLAPGMLMTALVRGPKVLIPSGDTCLEPGDVALIAVHRSPEALQRITSWARGEDLSG
jgi:potassium/hydrogen antiporter